MDPAALDKALAAVVAAIKKAIESIVFSSFVSVSVCFPGILFVLFLLFSLVFLFSFQAAPSSMDAEGLHVLIALLSSKSCFHPLPEAALPDRMRVLHDELEAPPAPLLSPAPSLPDSQVLWTTAATEHNRNGKKEKEPKWCLFVKC
jgi:hypothetical protein